MNRTQRSGFPLGRRLPWGMLLAAGFLAGRCPGAELSEAMSLFRSGRYLECGDAAGRAMEQRLYSETWRLLKIRAELACGRYREALAAYDEAIRDFPASVQLRWLGHRACLYNGLPQRAEQVLREIDELAGRAAWRYQDPESLVTLGRYYLFRGADARQVLEATFQRAKKGRPDYVEAYLACGQLALDKHDYALAAEEFEKARKFDFADAEVLLGLARAYAPSDAEKAESSLRAALQHNPCHTESLLFLADAHLDAERYDEAEETLCRIFQTNPLDPSAWAYRAVLAHLRNQHTDAELCRNVALTWWDGNPEVDYLIGRKLSQKYRFAEGAALQRRALQLDAGYLSAKIQLSQDLLRLGEDEEGWQLAAEVNARDGYNVVAHNLMALREHLSAFRVLQGEGITVRMDPRESEIYGRQVLELLGRARKELCAKYEVQLEGNVLVEIFPRQDDFAIRTFGLPGGAGFLGVCFGRLITANSPASQGNHPANWRAVLWHEFCHAVTLHKTNNRMPRWLSEGISVYEERQADATWGQSLTPRYRELIVGGALTPVSQLSGAFLRPPSPAHLQFAYYESSLVVEYLVQRYGLEALKRLLVELGGGLAINECLQRHVAPLETIDREFREWALQAARNLGPDVDWSRPKLSPSADTATWAVWAQANPKSYWAQHRYAQLLIAERKWQAARQTLQRLLQLYSGDDGLDSGHAMLARVHRELGDKEAERAALRELASRSAAAPAAYLRLMELDAERSDWENVARNAERMLAVNPLLPATHRYLAEAAEKLGQEQRAVDALRALLLLEPLDPAELHYRLAGLLQRSGRWAEARRHIVQCLEEAPRYRSALRRLLEIDRRAPQESATASEEGPGPRAVEVPGGTKEALR